MIFVDGIPFDHQCQGYNELVALMEHPFLMSSSLKMKETPEKEFSNLKAFSLHDLSPGRHVYIFQREYATVDPALVEFIGTDEATTCVGIVIRNKKSGMTSVTHMDSPDFVDVGLSQMLAEVAGDLIGSDLDVHLIGGFDDTSSNRADHTTQSCSQQKLDGWSLPLCLKIIEALRNSKENFHIQTFFVLSHNTRKDSQGIGYPIFTGFLVETLTGQVIPARFNESTRCPDELVRRIRLSASICDSNCSGLLKTYDTRTDQFTIAPFRWNKNLIKMASALLQLPDREVLQMCSTSPDAEAADFVETMRRGWNYLTRHPDWKTTFPMEKPRVFERSLGSGDGWVRLSGAQ